MDDNIERGESDHLLTEALREETGTWTPDCLDPEDIISFADLRGEYSESVRVVSHLAVCGYCRQQYWIVSESMHLADSINSLKTAEELETFQQTIRSTRLHFDWGELAASSEIDQRSYKGNFLNDTLTVTLWLDQGQTVLTAECYSKNVSLAGKIIQYIASGAGGDIVGYLVMPQSNDPAEVNIGPCSQISSGDLDFRLVQESELVDREIIRSSIRRARDLPSLQAWSLLLNRETTQLSGVAYNAIVDTLNYV